MKCRPSFLAPSALSSSEGYLILQYSFENEELCDSEEKQLQRGMFLGSIYTSLTRLGRFRFVGDRFVVS